MPEHATPPCLTAAEGDALTLPHTQLQRSGRIGDAHAVARSTKAGLPCGMTSLSERERDACLRFLSCGVQDYRLRGSSKQLQYGVNRISMLGANEMIPGCDTIPLA